MHGEELKKVARARNLSLTLLLASWFLAFSAWASQPDPVRFGLAVEQGDLVSVGGWLEAGLDPDFMADRVGSGLMIAAWEGNVPMLELFLRHGARVDLVNHYDEQALQLAAWKGHMEALKWLLAHGASVNRAGQHWSALHYAAFAGRQEVARLLIEHGSEINARAPNDSTALMMTAREGREDLAKLLLDAGADATLANEYGDSALTWAMRHEHFRIARMVSTVTEFSKAAKAAPESFGKAVRSQPAPAEIDEILRQIRLAQAAGKPADELRKKLFNAVARFKKESQVVVIKQRAQGKRGKPKALVITARRGQGGNAGGERAELVYAAQNPKQTPLSSAQQPAGAASAGTNEVPDILERITRARKEGEPVGDLRKALLEAIDRFQREEITAPAAGR